MFGQTVFQKTHKQKEKSIKRREEFAYCCCSQHSTNSCSSMSKSQFSPPVKNTKHHPHKFTKQTLAAYKEDYCCLVNVSPNFANNGLGRMTRKSDQQQFKITNAER